MSGEKARFEVVRSGAQPSSVLDSLIEKITPSSLDPRELLRDSLCLPKDLVAYLQEHCAPYGLELIEDTARDLYSPTERRYTLARGAQVSVALLQIPRWIVGNGNVVGTVDEIRTAFEGRLVRVLSPGCDAPSLALKKMFEDWKGRYEIDARFIAWANLKELERGFAVPDVLELELEPAAAAAADAATAVGGGGTTPEPAAAAQRSRVFVSYSHRDAEWLEKLQLQLKPLLRELGANGLQGADELLVWDDTKMEAGDRWRDEIRQALATAKVAVLLVSSNFLASDFIAEDELPPILAAGAEGQRILWVLLDACNWEATRIKDYDAAVKPLVRLDSLEEDDQKEALKKLSQLIVRYVQE